MNASQAFSISSEDSIDDGLLEIDGKVYTTDEAFARIPMNVLTEKYFFQKQLKGGAEGSVSVWRKIGGAERIVLKIIGPDAKHGHPSSLAHEIKALKYIGPHPRIINLLNDASQMPGPGFDTLVLEHCAGGDLFQSMVSQLEHYNKPFPEAFIWHVVTQLSEAIAYLHHGGPTPVVHRDIKCENILLRTPFDPNPRDGRWSDIVLADFGFAVTDPQSSVLSRPGYAGTEMWFPPQHRDNPDLGKPSADIWALGGVIHALVHGDPPQGIWKGRRRPADWMYRSKNVKSISNADLTFHGVAYSAKLDCLMQWCLREDPAHRPQAQDVITVLGNIELTSEERAGPHASTLSSINLENDRNNQGVPHMLEQRLMVSSTLCGNMRNTNEIEQDILVMGNFSEIPKDTYVPEQDEAQTARSMMEIDKTLHSELSMYEQEIPGFDGLQYEMPSDGVRNNSAEQQSALPGTVMEMLTCDRNSISLAMEQTALTTEEWLQTPSLNGATYDLSAQGRQPLQWNGEYKMPVDTDGSLLPQAEMDFGGGVHMAQVLQADSVGHIADAIMDAMNGGYHW